MKILNAIYRLLHRRHIFVNDILRFLSKIYSPIILEAGATDGGGYVAIRKVALFSGSYVCI